ncbi:hypothetical protein [Bradyrhizobium australiense]|uniref:DUF4149 domain-containing protein n=1 Tax=Bradyrhizobium australiense TaxID=2721161 RepID=A0A7Y4GNA6_9BRAD|nr:hypothetical protein [Bradyrhizobium australiense]NOJ38935.1 hypothetical protein [Bradyrhizobium australiense]
MTSDGIALAAIVILLFPMGYFFLASPAFLLVKLDIPPVAQLLRGMFNAHFLMLRIAALIGMVAFATAGRPVFAFGIALIAAVAIWGRGWFLRQWDAQLSARDAGDAAAVRRLRQLHWGGMLSNTVLLAAVVSSIPYISATSA